jgi:hypothetical protein
MALQNDLILSEISKFIDSFETKADWSRTCSRFHYNTIWSPQERRLQLCIAISHGDLDRVRMLCQDKRIAKESSDISDPVRVASNCNQPIALQLLITHGFIDRNQDIESATSGYLNNALLNDWGDIVEIFINNFEASSSWLEEVYTECIEGLCDVILPNVYHVICAHKNMNVFRFLPVYIEHRKFTDVVSLLRHPRFNVNNPEVVSDSYITAICGDKWRIIKILLADSRLNPPAVYGFFIPICALEACFDAPRNMKLFKRLVDTDRFPLENSPIFSHIVHYDDLEAFKILAQKYYTKGDVDWQIESPSMRDIFLEAAHSRSNAPSIFNFISNELLTH